MVSLTEKNKVFDQVRRISADTLLRHLGFKRHQVLFSYVKK